MNKTQKIDQVELAKELMQNSNAVYFVDYSKVTVENINSLRSEFRKEGIQYRVFKNTLLKRAVDELGYDSAVKGALVGMTGVAFVGENIAAPAKIIKAFSTKNQKFQFKACVIEKQYFGADKLEMLSTMPGKKELVASIIGSIHAPASGIHGAINAVIRDIVSLIGEIEKQKAA